jgi:hypothetical protein
VAFLVLAAACQGRRAAGPLPQGAYVWQREWTPAVRAAVAGASDFDLLVVLAAEVDPTSSPPRVARAGFDAAALRTAGRPVGLALRVRSFPGGFTTRPELAAELADLARESVARLRRAGLAPAELQLDYDCPVGRLEDYLPAVAAVRAAVAPVPVTLTALPSWLERGRAFAALAAAADGFVLQVHALAPPGSPGEDPPPLCDPVAARRAGERAARLRRPFRVALPTYSYTAAFGPAGELLGVAAEGPEPLLPRGGRLHTVASDPAALAGLVRAWTGDRLRELAGVLWYRLPVAGDRRNWPAATLSAVRAGRAPRPHLRLEAQASGLLVDLALDNAGEAPAPWPEALSVRWPGAPPLAADALGGYRIRRTGPTELQLVRADPALLDPPAPPLPPGARRPVAWLRFPLPTEVTFARAPTPSP